MQSPDNGIVNLPSQYSVTQTLDRLQALLKDKGIKIFARIDQAAEAKAVGLTMRPTVLLVFGDPRAGTPLMNAHPAIAMDLPLKALAWEDQEGKVWLSYNSPAYLKQRYDLPMEPFQPVAALLAQATG